MVDKYWQDINTGWNGNIDDFVNSHFAKYHFSGKDKLLKHIENYEKFRKLPDNLSTIAEFGAGYGLLAEIMLKRYKDLTYTIIDIEPMITIQKEYLKEYGDRVRWIETKDFESLMPLRVDMFIALWSLSEADENEQDFYDFDDFLCADYILIAGQEDSSTHNYIDNFHYICRHLEKEKESRGNVYYFK